MKNSEKTLMNMDAQDVASMEEKALIRSIRTKLCGFVLVCFALLCIGTTAMAGAYTTMNGVAYQKFPTEDFVISGTPISGKLAYGKERLGTFKIEGTVADEGTYKGTTVFGTKGQLKLIYEYNGGYHPKEEQYWSIWNSGIVKIDDVVVGGLFYYMSQGAIIVQGSYDGKTWFELAKPICNCFQKARTGKDSVIYTINEADVVYGMYYRVIVAYEMRRKPTKQSDWDYRRFIEVYEFRAMSEQQYVTVHDLESRSTLGTTASVRNGFFVRNNGSSHLITILLPDGTFQEAKSYDFFHAPGTYVVNEQTWFGQQYLTTVTVNEGMQFYKASSEFYTVQRDQGFDLGKGVKENKISPLEVNLSVPLDATMKESQKGHFKAFGISGKSVSIYLKATDEFLNIVKEKDIVYNKKQKVNGIQTGEIGMGALVVQTSKDGVSWNDPDKGKYARGLYTTDFLNHYDLNDNVLIYTPGGEDIIKGVYIRILFAYQEKERDKNEYIDRVVKFEFYLCCNDLDAVTFHNLSAEEILRETYGEENELTASLYKHAETMYSGACTTTGFTIDNSLNRTASYLVKRNGKNITVNSSSKLTENGRYDIHLKSALGDTKDVVLYVDSESDEDAMSRYFGQGFITDKRIYSEGTYPTFEGGKTKYALQMPTKKYRPLTGKIINESTGSEIMVENETDYTGVLTEPGQYVAVFANQPGYFTEDFSADARVFEYHFSIIPEGTAPGPVENQKVLRKYSQSNVSDYKPLFYSLTYPSAGKGYITLAFASREEAYNYAKAYESGLVEPQENGGYRYTGPFINVKQKDLYVSNWDVNDAIDYYANAAIEENYFDLSDAFTYETLEESTQKDIENYRTLELEHSVIVFPDGQKENMPVVEALPILNDKPYAYLSGIKHENADGTGESDTADIQKIVNGVADFKFATDKYGGIDSKTVSITDANGKEYSIEYEKSVGKQLKAANCPSGIVTITEETCYGDKAEYEAIYVAPDDTQVMAKLNYVVDGETKEIEVKRTTNPELVVDSFSLISVEDTLLTYPLVVVRGPNQQERAFTSDSDFSEKWVIPGTYTIKCVNRLGTAYAFTVTVNEKTITTTPVIDSALQTTEPPVTRSMPGETSQPISIPTTTPSKEADSIDQSAEETISPATDTGMAIIVVAAVLLFVAIGISVFIRQKIKGSEKEKGGK